jgi:hypothetical protein
MGRVTMKLNQYLKPAQRFSTLRREGGEREEGEGFKEGAISTKVTLLMGEDSSLTTFP